MEKKTLGKFTMDIGIEVTPRIFCSTFFIFASFNTTSLTNAFGRTYLTSKLQVSEKVTNSGGVMLVCRWEGINALVQNNFRSTSIYLLKVTNGNTS